MHTYYALSLYLSLPRQILICERTQHFLRHQLFPVIPERRAEEWWQFGSRRFKA